MNIFKLSAISFWLVLFLVFAVGCGEEKQKAKDRGEAIIDTVKDAEDSVNDAMKKMKEKAQQLEESDGN
jgi:hypothetical protein